MSKTSDMSLTHQNTLLETGLMSVLTYFRLSVKHLTMKQALVKYLVSILMTMMRVGIFGLMNFMLPLQSHLVSPFYLNESHC